METPEQQKRKIPSASDETSTEDCSTASSPGEEIAKLAITLRSDMDTCLLLRDSEFVPYKEVITRTGDSAQITASQFSFLVENNADYRFWLHKGRVFIIEANKVISPIHESAGAFMFRTICKYASKVSGAFPGVYGVLQRDQSENDRGGVTDFGITTDQRKDFTDHMNVAGEIVYSTLLPSGHTKAQDYLSMASIIAVVVIWIDYPWRVTDGNVLLDVTNGKCALLYYHRDTPKVNGVIPPSHVISFGHTALNAQDVDMIHEVTRCVHPNAQDQVPPHQRVFRGHGILDDQPCAAPVDPFYQFSIPGEVILVVHHGDVLAIDNATAIATLQPLFDLQINLFLLRSEIIVRGVTVMNTSRMRQL